MPIRSERVRRRLRDFRGQGEAVPPEAIAAQIEERDQRDRTRAEAPLTQAPDAVYIDSTGLSLDRSGRRDFKAGAGTSHQRKGLQLNDLLVMKFGGTSVGSAERMRIAARLSPPSERPQRPVAIVVSAMSKITDLLLDTMRHAEAGDRAGLDANIAKLRERHLETCRELLPPERQAGGRGRHRASDRRIRAHRRRHADAQRNAAALGG